MRLPWLLIWCLALVVGLYGGLYSLSSINRPVARTRGSAVSLSFFGQLPRVFIVCLLPTCTRECVVFCRQAVDVSPMRRVNQALYLLTTGAREASFRNIKTIAECLADELINAAKGSSNRYCFQSINVSCCPCGVQRGPASFLVRFRFGPQALGQCA